MGVKLLTEHHLEFKSLTGGCTGLSESTRHIVGNHMSRLTFIHIPFLIQFMQDLNAAVLERKCKINLKYNKKHNNNNEPWHVISNNVAF